MKHGRNSSWRLSSRFPHRSVGSRGRQSVLQLLEQRRLLAAQPVITEFMAKNGVSLTDGFGDNSDWIEIANQGDQSIDLVGWHLSDGSNLAKWTFPSFTLAPGQIRVVFASSRNTTDPAGNLHTNFSLSQDGEKLSLSRTDLSIASQFGPGGTNYPAQLADVSYGPGTIYDRVPLVGSGSTKRAFVPLNGSLDSGQWTAAGFNDSGWVSGTKGVGFDTGGYESNLLPPAIVGQWKATSLSSVLGSNATVTAWTDLVGGATAYGTGAPKFITNAMNGQPVVRFTTADGNDLLRVAAASNPLAGEEDFTVVVAFKANAGTGGSTQWYSNAGLVDAEVSGSTNDWGMSVSSTNGGRVGAGIGAPDTTIYSAGNVIGASHIAVFTRDDGRISLFLDGGNGVLATGSAAARALSDVVFGGLQTNANYFNGDIAEIRMYDGAMNSLMAFNISTSLATTYGVTTVTTPTNELGAVLNGSWTADSLNALANNASVTSWSSSVGTRNATAGGQPKLQKSQLNGHSVVRFNPNDGTSDNFRLAAAANPISNATDFSVAVVFRTSTGGTGLNTQWWSNTGLVDGEIGGQTNDWGLVFTSGGEIGAGIGDPDITTYSNTGHADGVAHVAILSRSGDTFRLSIDGGESYVAVASATARASSDMTFGSLQTNANYFTGDFAEIQTYSGALDEDAAHALAGQLADKYGVVLDADRYDPLVGIDLESYMAGTATTALVRIPFSVDNPSQFDKLLLAVQYDDGFIAYLNGVEIARRNVTGTATYASTADSPRLDNDAVAVESIDVSQHLGLLVNGTANLLSFRVLNSGIADPDLLLVPQLIAAKTTTGPAYLSPATPGAPNGEGFAGYVNDLAFSQSRGIYNAAFNLTVSTNTPATTLVYTLDGSEPTLTNGTAIAPASPTAPTNSFTISVNKSTTVRAVGFKNMYLPSTVGTQTYIFTASVLTQANTAPAGAYWDTEVDPEVVNASQTYSVSQALLALPSVSVVMNYEDMFGSTGIYKNPTQKGRQWERETSLEYFDPTGTTGNFQIDAGIRIQGGASRDPSKPKRSFRFYFRSEYGVGELDAPGLFGAGNPVTSFDHLVLRAGHNYTWANDGSGNADYLRDEFARQLQETVNGYSSRGSFVHLYLNGQYWGVYNFVEEPDENWASQHFGGSEDTYDLLEPDNAGGMELKSGTVDAWNNLFATVDAAYSSGGVDNTEYTTISQLVDVDALVGYVLTAYYRGDRDAPSLIGNDIDPRNFYAFRRNDIAGKFYFQTWDGELAMDDTNFDRTELQGNQNPARLFYRLRNNVEFRQLVTDKIFQLFNNGGPLQVSAGINKPLDRYNALVQQLDVGIVGESARWGDAKRASPFTRDTDWINAINWIRNMYLPTRSGVVLAQFVNDFPNAGRLPPRFYINGTLSRGGLITEGSTLTLIDPNTSPSGDQLYYTLDGTDPRAVGGGLSAGAILYSGPVTISSATTVTVRNRNGTSWSGTDRVVYTVATNGLRITEIAYQPAAPAAGTSNFTAGDFEFIELQNTGLTPLNISGSKFTSGITFTFPTTTTLGAGEYIIVARNVAAFEERYGTGRRIAGAYSGSLADEGELVVLSDSLNTTLHSFTYLPSWYPVTAGTGYTLVIRNALADKSVWDTAAGWRPSQNVNGSPGVLDPDLAPTVAVEPVAPNPRNTAIGTLNIAFSEPVTGFDLVDLTLSRSGGANLLTASATLTSVDGGMTWTLGNLGSLTGVDGTYTMSLNAGAGIVDLTGHALAGAGASTQFVIDMTAPQLVSSTLLLDGTSPQLRFTFDEIVAAGTSAPLLQIVRAGGGTVTATGYVISGNAITFNLPATLADGRYTATLTASGVADAAGNVPVVAAPQAFAFLAGDTNGDLRVDFTDLLTLAQNYGNSGRTFSQGNFDFDPQGNVDFSDLLILAQRYGVSLFATTPIIATTTRNSRSRDVLA